MGEQDGFNEYFLYRSLGWTFTFANQAFPCPVWAARAAGSSSRPLLRALVRVCAERSVLSRVLAGTHTDILKNNWSCRVGNLCAWCFLWEKAEILPPSRGIVSRGQSISAAPAGEGPVPSPPLGTAGNVCSSGVVVLWQHGHLAVLTELLPAPKQQNRYKGPLLYFTVCTSADRRLKS